MHGERMINYSARLNMRIHKQLLKALKIMAIKKNCTVTKIVTNAILEFLKKNN